MENLKTFASQVLTHPSNIRNIVISGNIDHGKHTLIETLRSQSQIPLNPDHNINLDTSTSKRASTILSYNPTPLEDLSNRVLINILELSGFTAKTDSTYKVADGALFVIDSVEGHYPPQSLLCQALLEKVKPVLMLNKIDRLILELQEDGEAIYQRFERLIDNINFCLSTYTLPDMGDITLDSVAGNIAFGSGIQQWAFTLNKFAKIYAVKFGLSQEKLVKKLWGDNYYDSEAKKWTTEASPGSSRAFVKFVMEPIIKLYKLIMAGDNQQIDAALQKINLQLTTAERESTGRQLTQIVMSKWLNCADCILDMITIHLPSPQVAQKYRVSCLYEGPQTDVCGQAMKDCDPNGPLMIYIYKMILRKDSQKCYALGRVFSGRVSAGQKVRILGRNHRPGRKDDLMISDLNEVGVLVGTQFEPVMDEIPCGNMVCIGGIDNFLVKTGTITTFEEAHKFRKVKQDDVQVWKYPIEPKNPADLPKFIAGLSKLSKPEPTIDIYREETGQYFITGISQLQVEVCLKDVADIIKCQITMLEPIAPFKETILEKSPDIYMSKSADKATRLYCQAEPLQDRLCDAIEKGGFDMTAPMLERTNQLVSEFEWTKEDAERIWAFGPNEAEANVLVFANHANYDEVIKENVVKTFEWAASEGVLAGENMRNIRFNLTDIEYQALNPKQIASAARRVFYACELASKPTLQEPIYSVEVTVPTSHVGGVYQALNTRRGTVNNENMLNGDKLILVQGFLPLTESIGFIELLRSLTEGQGFPALEFSHWETMEGDVFDQASKVCEVVKRIRKRKGLSQEIPNLQAYVDEL